MKSEICFILIKLKVWVYIWTDKLFQLLLIDKPICITLYLRTNRDNKSLTFLERERGGWKILAYKISNGY